MSVADTSSEILNAAARGDAAQVTALLSSGAKVEARDRDGRTPLLLATHGNHVEVARLLIAAGADVNAKNSAVRECMLAMPMRKTAAHVGTRLHALPHGQAG